MKLDDNKWNFIDARDVLVITFLVIYAVKFIIYQQFDFKITSLIFEPFFLFLPLFYYSRKYGTKHIKLFIFNERTRFYLNVRNGALLGLSIASISLLMDIVFFGEMKILQVFEIANIHFITRTIGSFFVKMFPLLSLFAICEEYFFRYVLYKGLRDKYGMLASSVICSIILLLSHNIKLNFTFANISGLVILFTLSVVSCFCYEKYKRLTMVVSIHLFYNSILIVKAQFWEYCIHLR